MDEKKELPKWGKPELRDAFDQAFGGEAEDEDLDALVDFVEFLAETSRKLKYHKARCLLAERLDSYLPPWLSDFVAFRLTPRFLLPQVDVILEFNVERLDDGATPGKFSVN